MVQSARAFLLAPLVEQPAIVLAAAHVLDLAYLTLLFLVLPISPAISVSVEGTVSLHYRPQFALRIPTVLPDRVDVRPSVATALLRQRPARPATTATSSLAMAALPRARLKHSAAMADLTLARSVTTPTRCPATAATIACVKDAPVLVQVQRATLVLHPAVQHFLVVWAYAMVMGNFHVKVPVIVSFLAYEQTQYAMIMEILAHQI
jgi:hypothetical protein